MNCLSRLLQDLQRARWRLQVATGVYYNELPISVMVLLRDNNYVITQAHTQC